MRFLSLPPYSWRFEDENRRTDGCKGLGMSERFNRFISYASPTYSEKDDVHRENTFDDIFLQYPDIIRVKVRGNFIVRFSVVYASVNLSLEPVHTSDNPIEVYYPLFPSVSHFHTEFPWGIVFSNSSSVPSRVLRRDLFHILFHLRCLT